MKTIPILVLAALTILLFPMVGDTENPPCNRLSKEKSPYLLQHQNNPVCWYPWGDEAFEAARKEHKPIFLSIGYSTCYWCHVMEKDSFEIEEVAKVMNKYFINIKLDREERPDIDQIYMDAVVAMRGQGGWPMSVFLTPDLKPFWGGTFFPRAQFIQIMEQIDQKWKEEPGKILEVGERLTEVLGSREGSLYSSVELDSELLHESRRVYESSFDSVYGGFGGAPKFPPSMQLGFLLRYYRRSGDKAVLRIVEKTLQSMAKGGLYDHLGGGFARYSTDEKWIVPHFEKMLYDNALLAVVYLEAFQVTEDRFYQNVAKETLDYILRDMQSEEGGFYSAEDAGEVEKEGEYYVWKYDELKEVLTQAELKRAEEVYGVTPEGSFEDDNNILVLQSGFSWDVKEEPILEAIHEKLLATRSKRISPHKDDKILTAWNGLMISAMAKGYQVLRDKRYLVAAQKGARFIREKLYKSNDGLLRRYREGESRFDGCLDDYAFMIEGLLNLYQSDFDPEWLKFAEVLQKEQDRRFWDPLGKGYFYSDSAQVIVRKKDFFDNAIPSGNSVALLNLLRLRDLTLEDNYRSRVSELLSTYSAQLERYPNGFPYALKGIDYFLDSSKEIVVVKGDDDSSEAELVKWLHRTFLPNQVVVVSSAGEYPGSLRGKVAEKERTTIYVCEEGRCELPTQEVETAKKLILKFQQLVAK